MTKFLALCQNTFVQTIRQPVYTWVLLVAIMILIGSLPMSGWAMGVDWRQNNQRMLEGMGLGTMLVCGLIVASLSASSVLSREIEDKTALTVISKPVSRPMFVAGKFVGVAGAVMLFFYIAALVYLMTLRHQVVPAAYHKIDWPVIVLGLSGLALGMGAAVAGNVMFGWPFTSAFVYSMTASLSLAALVIAKVGLGWNLVPFGMGMMRPQLFWAMALLAMALLIFVAIAIAASTRLGHVATLLICLGLFAIGSDHTKLFGHYSQQLVLAYPLHWLLPNPGHFYLIDALAQNNRIPGDYIIRAAAYCACYIVGVLAIGAALFQNRSLEGQSGDSAMPGAVSVLAVAGHVIALLAALIGIEAALAWAVGLWQEGFTPMVPLAGAWLLAGGAGLWVFCNYFARGNRWCYWALVGAMGVGGLGAAVAMVGLWDWPIRIAGVVATAPVVLLVVLLLPRTRRHFETTTVKTAS